MQPIDSFSVPRRPLDVEDYIDLLRRHKGWIFGPFLATLVASVVIAYMWPDSYVSSAVIQIKPQQISPQLVPTMSTQDIQDRINTLSNQVMSRSALSAMILNRGLYPRERSNMVLEDVQELMRRNIDLRASPVTVGGGRSLPAFQVSFSYHNRHDAMKVVQELASAMVAEDIAITSSASFQQQELMQELYDQAKKRLDAADEKMKEFRLANPGKLPDQMQANMAQLTAMQSQMQSLTAQSAQALNEKMGFESQINIIRGAIEQLERENRTIATAVAVAPPAKPKSAKILTLEGRVDAMRAQLATALQQYKDVHPVVRSIKGALEVAEQELDRARSEEAALEAATELPEVKTADPAVLANQRQIANLERNIQSLEFNIKARESDIARLQKLIQDYSTRVSELNLRIQSMPIGDQVLQDIAREQMLAKEAFIQADANLLKAKTSAGVTQRNQGEKLEILDAASLPQDPTDPNRPLWIGMGAGIGLAIGVLLAGAREMKDTSLKNLKDVRAYTQMAVLGSVPLLENDFVVRRRRRIAWLGWTVACLTAVVVMAGSIVYYYTVTKPS